MEHWEYVAIILPPVTAFIATLGGFIKVISNIKKKGKKVDAEEIVKECKIWGKKFLKLKKTLDKEIKKLGKDK